MFRLLALAKPGWLIPQQNTAALTSLLHCGFGKWSKPVKQHKTRERRTGVAISDEKAAKLSQSESEVEAKRARHNIV